MNKYKITMQSGKEYIIDYDPSVCFEIDMYIAKNVSVSLNTFLKINCYYIESVEVINE